MEQSRHLGNMRTHGPLLLADHHSVIHVGHLLWRRWVIAATRHYVALLSACLQAVDRASRAKTSYPICCLPDALNVSCIKTPFMTPTTAKPIVNLWNKPQQHKCNHMYLREP